VAEVFAGFVCGYILALLSTPLLALMLLRLRAGSELFQRLLPPGVSALGLSVLLHGGLFLFWTAVGMLLGLVLLAMEGEGGALGSLNGPFSLFVVGVVLAFAAPVIVVARRARQLAIACVVGVVVVFGWLMPYMAEWSSFD
jgi:hypothetical protein